MLLHLAKSIETTVQNYRNILWKSFYILSDSILLKK